MSAQWENAVRVFERMYPHTPRRPETQAFLDALERAAPSATTMEVPGNGNCLLSALNAASADLIPASAGRGMYESWATAHPEEAAALRISGELRAGDLQDDKKNDASIFWLDIIAYATGRQINVLVSRNGDLSVHVAKNPDLGSFSVSTEHLLLRDGHFWPLKGDIDMSKWTDAGGGAARPAQPTENTFAVVLQTPKHDLYEEVKPSQRVSALLDKHPRLGPGKLYVQGTADEVDPTKTFAQNGITTFQQLVFQSRGGFADAAAM